MDNSIGALDVQLSNDELAWLNLQKEATPIAVTA
jgi:hypothetical protein